MTEFPCEECENGIVHQQRVEHEANFRGMKFLIKDAMAGVCDKCGARYFKGKEIERWEKLFEINLQEKQHPLSPTEIKEIRAKLGLNQRQFSVLIGATRQSLYNWENEERQTPQSRQADLIIRVLKEYLENPGDNILDFLLSEARRIGVNLPSPQKPQRQKVTPLTERMKRTTSVPTWGSAQDFDNLFPNQMQKPLPRLRTN